MAFLDTLTKVASTVKKSYDTAKEQANNTGSTYKVGSDGKAPSGLNVGDSVVTGGGTYKITGVNSDGTYQSALSDANQTTNNYTGNYANVNKGISSNINTYEDDINKYKALQTEATTAQLKQAKEKALANLDVQEQQIKPMYQNQRNIASGNSQQGARSFAEYLANRGLSNSGAAAQGEMNRLSALQNTMGNIGTAEANAYRDIANQRTQIENDYVNNLASANAQIEADYYKNLMDYNQQQREKIEALQQQALGQYANDYQAYMDTLDPNSMEYLYASAARGNKMSNAYQTSQENALTRIANGNWTYNDLLTTGFTEEQAQEYHNQVLAQAQAEAEQQAFNNWLKEQELALKTAQVNYQINKPYYKPNSGGNQKQKTLTTSQYNSIVNYLDKIDTNTKSGYDKAQDYIYGLYSNNFITADQARDFAERYNVQGNQIQNELGTLVGKAKNIVSSIIK